MEDVVADKRLYLNADKTELVEEGSPDAAFLLASPGNVIPSDVAEFYGVTSTAKSITDVIAPEDPAHPDNWPDHVKNPRGVVFGPNTEGTLPDNEGNKVAMRAMAREGAMLREHPARDESPDGRRAHAQTTAIAGNSNALKAQTVAPNTKDQSGPDNTKGAKTKSGAPLITPPAEPTSPASTSTPTTVTPPNDKGEETK